MSPTAQKSSQKASAQKTSQKAAQDREATPPFGEGARSVAEEFVARGADALSGAAGLLQGVERESRTQFRDVSRRMARRLELVEEEEFVALREQVRDLSKRVAALEGGKSTPKKTVQKKTQKKTVKKTVKKAARKNTGKKAQKKTPKKTTKKKAAPKKTKAKKTPAKRK